MLKTTSNETFFQSSGSSPPLGRKPALDTVSHPTEPREMPPDLIEELGRLLGEALAADIRQYPNLAELHASRAATVESPPGHDRRAVPTEPLQAHSEPAARDTRPVTARRRRRRVEVAAT